MLGGSEMLRELVLGTAALMLGSTAARAEWREASSKHFLVYSEGSEASLRAAVVKLEKYDFLLRFASGKLKAPSGAKAKVYMVSDMKAVAASLPFGGMGVGGYYEANLRGAYFVTPRSSVTDTVRGTYRVDPQQVLFHEYAHHFMFQYFPATYPTWYSEGFAEYYGTTRLLPNEVMEVGQPANHRYASLEGNQWLPVNKLLTARSYADVGSRLHLLYAQGWLLVHYAAFNKEAGAQLKQYLNAINAGQSYETAAGAAFGAGAKQLNNALQDYARNGQLKVVRLPFKPIDVGPIVIRELSPAENALLGEELALDSGVPAADAGRFAARVRRTAARFPDDPHALRVLTEAERLAGNRANAAAAVERWLAVQPGAALALMHKGALRAEELRAASSRDEAAWDAARKLIFDAHRRAPAEPQILVAYYDSFAAQGRLPPAGAQNGLVRAFELLPQNDDLRYRVAWDFEQRGMIEVAIQTIRPAALAFHEDETPERKARREKREAEYRLAGEATRETAREMLMRLEAKFAGGKPVAAPKGGAGRR